MILLRDANDLKFRAVYEYDVASDRGVKLYGRGPAELHSAAVVNFFRYSSANRTFSPLQTSAIGLRVDACCIKSKKQHTRR